MMMAKQSTNRYMAVIAAIFDRYYRPDATQIDFRREDIIIAATELGITLPRNLGDVLYSFRYRAELPESITRTVYRRFVHSLI